MTEPRERESRALAWAMIFLVVGLVVVLLVALFVFFAVKGV